MLRTAKKSQEGSTHLQIHRAEARGVRPVGALGRHRLRGGDGGRDAPISAPVFLVCLRPRSTIKDAPMSTAPGGARRKAQGALFRPFADARARLAHGRREARGAWLRPCMPRPVQSASCRKATQQLVLSAASVLMCDPSTPDRARSLSGVADRARSLSGVLLSGGLRIVPRSAASFQCFSSASSAAMASGVAISRG